MAQAVDLFQASITIVVGAEETEFVLDVANVCRASGLFRTELNTNALDTTYKLSKVKPFVFRMFCEFAYGKTINVGKTSWDLNLALTFKLSKDLEAPKFGEQVLQLFARIVKSRDQPPSWGTIGHIFQPKHNYSASLKQLAVDAIVWTESGSGYLSRNPVLYQYREFVMLLDERKDSRIKHLLQNKKAIEPYTISVVDYLQLDERVIPSVEPGVHDDEPTVVELED